MARFKLINGERVAFTAEEETARDAEEAASIASQAATAYIRNRKNNYPLIGDQLDLLWHAIDADSDLKVKLSGFYNAIKAVKDANPKPS
tara:strand:- start:41 stop:307 length:267 start_codon:yes stop_codon:yes gene_type:complete